MGEYRVEVKVKNNLIYSKITKMGYDSIPVFCKEKDVSYSCVVKLIAMTLSPLNKKNDFIPTVYKLCDIFLCSPEDLFTQTQLDTIVEKSTFVKIVKEAELAFFLETTQDTPSLEDMVDQGNKIKRLGESLKKNLTSRENEVIKLRFGLSGCGEHTLEDAANAMGVTRERIRQLEAKALRKLRNPYHAGRYIETGI